MNIKTIDVCNEQINDVVKILLEKKIRAKLVLNFDGNGNIVPELTVNNESLFKIILVKRENSFAK